MTTAWLREWAGRPFREANAMNTSILFNLLIAAAVLRANPVVDPATPAGRHACVIQHLKRTAAELSDHCLSDPVSLEHWTEERPVHQRQLRYMLGLDPLPQRTPLNARVTGTLEFPEYRIEMVVFQSLPGLYVTANLYVPRERPAPLPAILYACGHSPHPRGAKVDYQDRVVWFARHGYVVLIVDTLEFGEVPGIHHGIHDLNMWHWISLGYTPIGVEVWNAMRAIDYLQSRPEVDGGQIGMTGISGGGAATWYTAAVDERVSVAVPVCSTITFGTQARNWRAAGQCDCIYFHNTYLTDFPIVAALIAPRPLLICSGRRDGDFMPEGYHQVFRRSQRIYELYADAAASQRIVEVDDDVGHTDAPLFRQAARQWMNRWLKNDTSSVALPAASDERQENAADLACLDRLPADAINYRIHDSFIPTVRMEPSESIDAWQHRRERLAAELREYVVRSFPRESVPFETRAGTSDGGWADRYAQYRDVLFQSELSVWVRAQLLQPREQATEAPLLIYAKRPGDSIYFLDLDELLPLLGRYNVLILNPRLTEFPVNAAEYAEIERTATWIGRTVASMQLFDILRAVQWTLEEEKLTPSSISLYGKGDMAILALYAGVLDERIGRVVMCDPPTTHWRGPALLNVLRVTDIPEVAGAFAPRQLVVLRDVPAAFEPARRIYQLHNAADRLSAAGSLPEALKLWERSMR
jgi:dienelactone hydrolase